jgi:cob(I)alamin adenosyltransferase
MIAQLENTNLKENFNSPYPVEGLIQVFTSCHRDFFTNVMAQSLRIAGQGTPVLIVQFLKGGINQGPENSTQLGKYLDWIRCDLPRHIDTAQLDDKEAIALKNLWQHTQTKVNEGKYSLVVLDELSLAINFGFISESEVLSFLTNRPANVDIIFTGSEMPKSLLDIADQITEIRRQHRP